ncbi:MAG: RNA polymerase subunit sigma-24 [Verrucomicrobia bacterium]|nr:MAG: RNA polymerase subunit sigma-24 [Verrucomicrobiota bacterium]
MSVQQSTQTPPLDQARWFATTHWSVVLAVGQGESNQSEQALEKLCRAYWYPLYAYTRRRGCDAHQAQDLVQGFFVHFLAKNYLEGVSSERGKFRSFLLTCFNHFLSNEWDRSQTLKRGGRHTFISLHDEDAEERYTHEPATSATPDKIFERRWALAVLEHALQRLQQELATTGRAAQFERLKGFLEGEVARGDYDRAAADLKVSPGAVAMAVNRLRQRYRQLVREEVAQTVGEMSQIEEEMRHLIAALSGV